jgi:hypothetical protein
MRTYLVSMIADRIPGRLATVKDGGVMKAGRDQEALVEVIAVVLEVGFGTIFHRFSNLDISLSKMGGRYTLCISMTAISLVLRDSMSSDGLLLAI